MMLNCCFCQKWYGGVPVRLHPLWFKFYFWFVSCLNTLFALFRITKNDKSALRFTCPFEWLIFLAAHLVLSLILCFLFSGLVYKYPLSEQWHLVSSILLQVLQKMLWNVCIANSVFLHILFHPLHFILKLSNLTRWYAVILGLVSGENLNQHKLWKQLSKEANCSPVPNHIPYILYEKCFVLWAWKMFQLSFEHQPAD